MKRKINFYFLCLLLFSIFLSFSINSENNLENEWKKADEIVNSIKIPEFKNNIIYIKDIGGKGDSVTDNTTIINKAIKKLNKKGGGTLVFNEGNYLTGKIVLLSNVQLKIEEDAVLLFSTNPDDYLPLVLTRWEGVDCYNYSPLIYAYGQKNIAITGKGKIDGQASYENWWKWKGQSAVKTQNTSLEKMSGRFLLLEYNKQNIPVEQRKLGNGHYLRPPFIQFYKCSNILIDGISIANSPFWIIHPLLSENIVVRNVVINSMGPNNDGCDPESCKNMLIENCFFKTGDDCIAIKSGRNEDGRKWNIPSENIVVRKCIMRDGHGGVVIGSEVSGGCKNVFVENCEMDSPELDRAIRIKSNSLRGGVVENLFVRNIKVGQVKESVVHINCLYDPKEGTGIYYPLIRNVFVYNVTSNKAKYGVYIIGIENKNTVNSIYLNNCNFQNVSIPYMIKYASEVWLQNVIINNEIFDNINICRE